MIHGHHNIAKIVPTLPYLPEEQKILHITDTILDAIVYTSALSTCCLILNMFYDINLSAGSSFSLSVYSSGGSFRGNLLTKSAIDADKCTNLIPFTFPIEIKNGEYLRVVSTSSHLTQVTLYYIERKY